MRDNTVRINGTSIAVESLTFEDLRVHFRTGRNVHISGSGRNRISRYHTGVLTNIGEVEVAVWMDLMRKVITRLGETELQQQLQQWVKENCAWVHTAEQVEQESLEFHAMRIFDNPAWVSYRDFNRRYRPDLVLKDPSEEGENLNG